MATIEERFWGKIDRRGPDECWLWTAGKFKSGYGAFGITHSRIIRAHRFAYELKHGSIPDEIDILHTCDNPACVNPAHLFPGTNYDNMQDAARKGRLSNRRQNYKDGHPFWPPHLANDGQPSTHAYTHAEEV